jgi:hypothetical protein
MRVSEFFPIHNLRVCVLALASSVAFGVLPEGRIAPPTISQGSPSNGDSGPSLTNQKTNAGDQCQQRNQKAELAE